MGSACCVAVKDRKVSSPPTGSSTTTTTTTTSLVVPASLNRNSVCSPQWSFRRGRVADEIDGSSPYYVGSSDKMSLGSERGTTLSPPLDASRKSTNPETSFNSIVPPSSAETSLASHDPVEVKSLVESPSIVPSAIPKPFVSTPIRDLPSAHSRLLPPKSTPSRKARHSPGHQLFRQVSDSQILGMKSPNSNNNYSVSEGRSSNDFAVGSHYASSEGGWSINTFSELVAYSQRQQRWSFDSEQHFGGGSSSRFSFSPSVVIDQQTCIACSKLLTERSSIAISELPIAAVLACGHVYHAECLETMTTEIEKYDPACPICTIGEKQVAKITRKALKAEAESKAKQYKRCKNRVVDSYGESESDEFVFQKREGKAPKMDPSCSSNKGLPKSFLKSISSKLSKPKKGFWSRHRSNRSSSSIEELNQTSRRR